MLKHLSKNDSRRFELFRSVFAECEMTREELGRLELSIKSTEFLDTAMKLAAQLKSQTEAANSLANTIKPFSSGWPCEIETVLSKLKDEESWSGFPDDFIHTSLGRAQGVCEMLTSFVRQDSTPNKDYVKQIAADVIWDICGRIDEVSYCLELVDSYLVKTESTAAAA